MAVLVRSAIASVLLALAFTTSAHAATPIALHVPVLMYHRIQCPDADTRLPGLFVCPDTLDAQMTMLAANGWHTISVAQLADDMLNGVCPAPKTFAITVDDGALDGYTNGAPIWEAHDMTATFAMVTGKAGDYLTGGGGSKPHFSWDQARDLIARGFGIANHTVKHTSVKNDSRAALDREVQAAQDKIATEVGATTVFVYPYGSFGSAETSYLAARFAIAFTTKAGAFENPADPMHAPRIRVSHSTTPSALLSRLNTWKVPC